MDRNRFGDTWPERAADHRVVVLGASPKRSRYSNQAVRMLQRHGYQIVPVHPKVGIIEGLEVTPGLHGIEQPVHTLTLYVGPERSRPLIDDIVALNPRRVILNPGTESAPLEEALRHHHIHFFAACTLVMLSTNQFDAW